jgi:hypothetical protein
MFDFFVPCYHTFVMTPLDQMGAVDSGKNPAEVKGACLNPSGVPVVNVLTMVEDMHILQGSPSCLPYTPWGAVGEMGSPVLEAN